MYDVIIIGGGIVGLTLARRLAPELRIGIIENKAPPIQLTDKKFDLRVSAINRASQKIFREINIWQDLKRVAPFHGMQVWDASGNGEIKFDCCEMGESDLGHIVENNVMLAALSNNLSANIDYICPAQAQKISRQTGQVNLVLNDGRQLITRLLIGADGVNSWVREQAGIDARSWSYQQQALVTTIRSELPHEAVARQQFLHENGILALLPLPDTHHCSIVWSIPTDHAEKLMRISAEDFNQTLTTAFPYLGALQKIDQLQQFPLQMRHAKNYVQARIALIGDAAHSIHPLAGQGVNLGIADANSLAEIININFKKHRDIGNLYNLRAYERARKGQNLLMINLMEGFKRLFAANSSIVIQARNFGLTQVNKNNFMKNFFMRRAMGL